MEYIIDVPDDDSGHIYNDGYVIRTNGYVTVNMKIDNLKPHIRKDIEELFETLYKNKVSALPYLEICDTYYEWKKAKESE